MTTGNEAYRRSLRWQMRRGLLELDIIMRRFVADGFEALADEDLAALETLLALPDPELLDVLSGRVQNPDPKLQLVIAAIRQVASRPLGAFD